MNDSRIANARQTLADAVAAASHGALAALFLPTNVQMANVEVWGPAAAGSSRPRRGPP
jgi:hypothetical protein